jgi:acyl-homoserine lactone acylase PvdQ
MTALGYVHAQDRLWQMELMRRIARTTFGDFRKSGIKE